MGTNVGKLESEVSELERTVEGVDGQNLVQLQQYAPGMLQLIAVESEYLASLKSEQAQSTKISGQPGNNKTGKEIGTFEARSRFYICRG